MHATPAAVGVGVAVGVAVGAVQLPLPSKILSTSLRSHEYGKPKLMSVTCRADGAVCLSVSIV